ncbi:hypothetical protein [Mesorhizobium sp. M0047]|uniref:hypothetical protein n=1 Tax=Mesorhizobium sp. M0047 TaxID=2956859 RepID=UPI00333A8A23
MEQLASPVVTACDSDILRSVFTKSVIEDNIPEDQWRDYAAKMVRDFAGQAMVEPELLDRIMQK